MYEAFFGLAKRPFAPMPDAERFFPAGSIEAARQTLARCIQRAEGVGMIVGPSGTGKTILTQVLAKQFAKCLDVVVLSHGRPSTRRALLQAILHGLGQTYRGLDEGELRLTLIDHLGCRKRCPNGMLLLVDEAHTLPLRLLDELRMLSNLALDGEPRIRLVLAGAPSLEEHLTNPRLDSFSQRLVARCYLEAFHRDETERYIHWRIDAVGGQGPSVFLPEACQAVHQATDGVPRLINQVCDHALLLAAGGERTRIDAAEVEAAWADLQQLPTPWNGNREPAASNSIEFGCLEDEPADAPATQPAPVPCRADDLTSGLVEQVEHIQQMLGAMEDGRLGEEVPEIEARFDLGEPSAEAPANDECPVSESQANPFVEPFAREEVVADRFSGAEREGSVGVVAAAVDAGEALRRRQYRQLFSKLSRR